LNPQIPRRIERPRLILGEGVEDERFLRTLLRAAGLDPEGFEILEFGGKHGLAGFLGTLKLTPGFEERVAAVLITVDADQDAQAAFQRAAEALTRNELPRPPQPAHFVGSAPEVAVWVFPDNRSPGCLETLCRRALRSHRLAGCVDGFMGCCAPQDQAQADKAWVYAFLACQPNPRRRLGELSPDDLSSWDLSAFDGLLSLVRQM
jgi:hypothetical protein